MNEEIKTRLFKYLDLLEGSVKEAGDLAKNEIPDIIQQWITWEFWSSITLLVLFLICVVLLWVARKKIYDISQMLDGNDRTAARFISTLICCAGTCAFLGGCGYNIYHAVKVKTAPKVVIIEKIAEFIKGTKR